MLSSLRPSSSSAVLGEWRDPKALLGNDRVCEQRVQMIKADLQHDLKTELDKNNELSTLLMLLAADAKKMKLNSNKIIAVCEGRINELIQEVDEKECRLHQLHLDLEIAVNDNHRLLDVEFQQKNKIAELQSDIHRLESSLELLGKKYHDLTDDMTERTRIHQEEIISLTASRDDLQSQLSSAEASLQSAQQTLMASVRARAAASLFHSFCKLQLRLCHKALGQWRAYSALEVALASFQRRLHSELVSMQTQCGATVQQLEERHRVDLEEQRRKYARVYDARNAIMHDLIRAKRRSHLHALSLWKSKFISCLHVKYLKEKRRNEELSSDLKASSLQTRAKGAQIIIMACRRLHRHHLSVAFNEWEKKTKNHKLVSDLEDQLQLQSLRHDRHIGQLQDELNTLKIVHESDRRKWETRALALTSLEERLSAEMLDLKMAVASISRRKSFAADDEARQLLLDSNTADLDEMRTQVRAAEWRSSKLESEVRSKDSELAHCKEAYSVISSDLNVLGREKEQAEARALQIQSDNERLRTENKRLQDLLSSSDSSDNSALIKDLIESRAFTDELQRSLQARQAQLAITEANLSRMEQRATSAETQAEQLEIILLERNKMEPSPVFERASSSAAMNFDALSKWFQVLYLRVYCFLYHACIESNEKGRYVQGFRCSS